VVRRAVVWRLVAMTQARVSASTIQTIRALSVSSSLLSWL
jgi:hypothetical protein